MPWIDDRQTTVGRFDHPVVSDVTGHQHIGPRRGRRPDIRRPRAGNDRHTSDGPARIAADPHSPVPQRTGHPIDQIPQADRFGWPSHSTGHPQIPYCRVNVEGRLLIGMGRRQRPEHGVAAGGCHGHLDPGFRLPVQCSGLPDHRGRTVSGEEGAGSFGAMGTVRIVADGPATGGRHGVRHKVGGGGRNEGHHFDRFARVDRAKPGRVDQPERIGEGVGAAARGNIEVGVGHRQGGSGSDEPEGAPHRRAPGGEKGSRSEKQRMVGDQQIDSEVLHAGNHRFGHFMANGNGAGRGRRIAELQAHRIPTGGLVPGSRQPQMGEYLSHVHWHKMVPVPVPAFRLMSWRHQMARSQTMSWRRRSDLRQPRSGSRPTSLSGSGSPKPRVAV